MTKLSGFICVFLALFLTASSSIVLAQDSSSLHALPDFLQAPQNSADTGVVKEGTAPPITTTQTHIEDDTNIPKEDTSTPRSDLSDIPDSYIMEATAFGDECRNSSEMPLFYDCRCLAVKFLDKRIEVGPNIEGAAIRLTLGKECKNGTGIAGQIYQDCLQDFVHAPLNLDPEEFCGCYGNTFGKYFENLNGQMNNRMRMALTVKARLRCQDPAAALKVYGVER